VESSGDTIIRNVSATRNKLLTKACNLVFFTCITMQTVKSVCNYAVCLMLSDSACCETSCLQH